MPDCGPTHHDACACREAKHREEIARLARERDAAQEECHRLLAPLRNTYDSCRVLLDGLTKQPSMSGRVEVSQDDLRDLRRRLEADTVRLNELTKQRDLARAECVEWRRMRDAGLIALPEEGCCDLVLAVAANHMEDKNDA